MKDYLREIIKEMKKKTGEEAVNIYNESKDLRMKEFAKRLK